MLELVPLTPGFGAEVRNVEVSAPLDDATFAEVEQALFRHQVLVLPSQQVTSAQFLAFARRFGAPEPHVIDQFHHPDDPNILILSNVVIDDEPQGLADAGLFFHTNYSFLETPARATLLYSIEVPEAGGDTLFANQYAAYDDLPEAMKRRLEGLRAIHRWGNRSDHTTRRRAPRLSAEQQTKVRPVTHPIVRAHPVTGRRALYAVSGSSYGIVGMPEDEAVDLLDELARHATADRYVYRHAYGVGDVIVWDNASILHCATPTDPEHPRTLWRITIKEGPATGHAQGPGSSLASSER